MDTLTHALSGALLGRATAPAAGRHTLPLGRRMLVGALAAAFPDSDIVFTWLSPLAYLHNHRGITHSLLMLPLWTLLLAWLCTLVWRNNGRSGPGMRAYAGIIAMSIAAHILGDLLTSYGTMIFAPLSDARYGIGTTFIIDLCFSGIIVAGLVACTIWRRSRLPAVIGLLVLCAYVGFQFVLQQRAIAVGEQYAQAQSLRGARVYAEPRPPLPFNWMVVVDQGDAYHYALISLLRDTPPPPLAPDAGFVARLGAPYLPVSDAVWVAAPRWGVEGERVLAQTAFAQPGFAFFRWFARYPVLERLDTGSAQTCAWFQDLRFFTPGRPSWPFRYGMCREGASGVWRPYELMGDNNRIAVD